MGIVSNVGFDVFPKQGNLLGREVDVCFNYDVQNALPGIVLRDDTEDPWVTIIKLSDGRVILSTECQFRVQRTTDDD